MEQKSRLVIEIDSRNAERNTLAIANELENLTVKGYKAERQMTAMSGSIKSLVGYMGGLLTINKAIAMADGYTQMAARIRNATTSAEEYQLVQDRVLATAQTTYRSLSEAQEVYLSLSGGMRSLGKSTSETLDLVDSLSFSFTHNATRTDQAQSAMDALSKAMAKGKVDTDAWISIVTGADNIIADMAKTTGKSEAEIRQLGATGKASLEDLIKTLIATREQNERLANNMENSLADGFTTLSNAVTVYLGQANEATSATGLMAGALGTLAENLETVANVAMLGGVAYLTKTIVEKTVAIYGTVTAYGVQRAATTAQTQAEIANATAVLNNTRAHLASVQATNAATQAKHGATVANLRYKTAVDAVTAAELRLTAASSGARSGSSLLARGLTFLSGPVAAMTIGVTALTAGYMYMSNRAAEANKKLAEQAEVAKRAKEELLKLKGIEKDKAIDDMTESLKRQNEALSESSSKVFVQLNAIKQLYSGNKQIIKVVEDAQNGTITMTQAIERFNELRIDDSVYNAIKKNSKEFVTNAKEATNTRDKLALVGEKYELTGNKAMVAANGVDANTKALKSNKNAAEGAAEAQRGYFESLNQEILGANERLAYMGVGYSREVIDEINKLKEAKQKALGDGVTVIITDDEINSIIKAQDILNRVKEKEEEITKAKQAQTKELQEQQKILTVSAQVQANAAKYNFGGLESRYGLPNGMLAALHAIETGNSGKTGQVNKQSGATGGFQFLSGTATQYGVKDRTNMAQSAEGAAKYMSYLLGLFKGDLEKAVRAYHAGEGNVQRGTNIGKYNNDYWEKFKGYSAGLNGLSNSGVSSKDFESLLKESMRFAEEQAKSRKSLELEVANEVTKIRENLKDKLIEINKAGFSPEDTARLKAEYQSRADTDIAIAEYALKTKLDDYSDFQKSEVQLLEKSYAQKMFYASKDIELSDKQKTEALSILNQQLQQELAYLELTKEQRLFQLRQRFLTESQVMEQRYQLEENGLIKINDIQERNFQRQMIRLQKEEETRKRMNDAAIAWAQVESQMRNSGGQMQVEQNRFSRLDASQGVFDSQMGAVDMEEKGALDRVQDKLNKGLIDQQEFENQKTEIMRIAMETRQAIHEEHVARQMEVEGAYIRDSINLQLTQAQQLTGSFASMFRGILGESSSAYRMMYAMQQGFAIAQAGINLWSSASDAYAKSASPTVWGRMADAGKAMLDQGTFLAMIQSITPQGFASGGLVRGPGTGTSDSIPAWLSDEEFVIKARSVKSIGAENLDYMNRTGKLPQIQRERDTARVLQGGGQIAVQPKIIINAPPGTHAETSTDSEGAITIDIVRKEAREAADSAVKRSWSQVQNSNSHEAKQISKTFDVKFKRF